MLTLSAGNTAALVNCSDLATFPPPTLPAAQTHCSSPGLLSLGEQIDIQVQNLRSQLATSDQSERARTARRDQHLWVEANFRRCSRRPTAKRAACLLSAYQQRVAELSREVGGEATLAMANKVGQYQPALETGQTGRLEINLITPDQALLSLEVKPSGARFAEGCTLPPSPARLLNTGIVFVGQADCLLLITPTPLGVAVDQAGCDQLCSGRGLLSGHYIIE